MYSQNDLIEANKQLEQLEEKWARYDGNNPNKYRSQLRSLRLKVELITEHFKSTGTIPLTEKEVMHNRLDAAFPNARSKQVVEFHGVKYQRRFYPLQKSRSGKSVTEWGRDWVVLESSTL